MNNPEAVSGDFSPVMEYLRQLVEVTGPSGSEEDVARRVLELARPHADELSVDTVGNVIAVRRAEGSAARRLLICAHMDEIGFRVRRVDEGGTLRLEKVGGSDDRILPAQRVWVRTEEGRIPGVIGTKSAHLLTDADRASVTPYAQLYVDIGARSAAEAAAMGVQPGDPVGFAGELTELGRNSGRYTAHALDDRAGCAVLLALLAGFSGDARPPVTLVAAFSVQEEVGLRGAQVLAHALPAGQTPDVALALDMTAADDTPELGAPTLRLGAGPTVKVMDFSTLAHPAVRRGLLRAAQSREIAVQHELLKGIGTDAGALQYLGVPTGAVSVTNRYTHSPVEVLDRRDLEAAQALLLGFMHDLPETPLDFLPTP